MNHCHIVRRNSKKEAFQFFEENNSFMLCDRSLKGKQNDGATKLKKILTETLKKTSNGNNQNKLQKK